MEMLQFVINLRWEHYFYESSIVLMKFIKTCIGWNFLIKNSVWFFLTLIYSFILTKKQETLSDLFSLKEKISKVTSFYPKYPPRLFL